MPSEIAPRVFLPMLPSLRTFRAREPFRALRRSSCGCQFFALWRVYRSTLPRIRPHREKAKKSQIFAPCAVLRSRSRSRVALSRRFSARVRRSRSRPSKYTPESINAPKTRKNQPIKAQRKKRSFKLRLFLPFYFEIFGIYYFKIIVDKVVNICPIYNIIVAVKVPRFYAIL